MSFLRLTYYELIKTFLKKRTYLGFLIILIIIPLVVYAFKMEGGRFLRMATKNLAQDFMFLGAFFNGWNAGYQLMSVLWIHIPLLISFVAGDQLAGEATGGTYRLMLIKPVSRTRILLAKYVTTLIYTVVFVLFLGVLSVGLSLLVLGRGDLVIVRSGILVLPESEVAWRFIVAYILAIWAMITVSSISFFLSSFVENAIGPIVGTMGFIIILMVLTALPLEVLAGLRPYFFTTHMALWQGVFADPVDWKVIVDSCVNLGVYSLAAFIGTWIIFVRKDILT